MQKKILITGATGFLGSALSKRLNSDGHSVVSLGSKDADLTKNDSLSKFKNTDFDYIYHLAAWTQAGDFCLTHMGEQWLINQMINTNVLAFWKNHCPQAKLISMGTSCSYPTDLPHAEENYLVGKPIEDLYTYAMTKRMLLIGQKSLNAQFKMRYLTAIPSTVYGPGYFSKNKQMHFIFDLINKILRAKYYGDEVVLWGDGHQKRELVFIDDFIEALLALADKVDNDIVNIGGGEEFSIRTFASQICEVVGYDPAKIKYDETRYVGARSKFLVVEKLNKILPGRKQTPLSEGIKTSVEWFRNEYFSHKD